MKQAKACVLTVNGGSSSIKFALFDAGHTLRRILAGSIEQIGMPDATFVVKGLNKADNFTRSVAAPNTYHYDASGNMTQRVEKGVTWTRTFDAENHLVSVSNGTTTTNYEYAVRG